MRVRATRTSDGAFGEAIRCYGDALKKLEGDGEAGADGDLRVTLLANRAACYLNLNRPWLAMIDCTAVLERNPSHQKALYRRALAFRSMGKHDKALADLRDLTSQDVDDATLAKVRKIMQPLKKAAAAAAKLLLLLQHPLPPLRPLPTPQTRTATTTTTVTMKTTRQV